MKPKPIQTLVFVLVVALTLPLRGFAAAFMPCPDMGTVSAASSHVHMQMQMQMQMAEFSSDQSAIRSQAHHDHPSTQGHVADGSCCCTAMIDPSPAQWVPPPPSTPERSAPHVLSPHAVTPDGLDRPPRTVLG